MILTAETTALSDEERYEQLTRQIRAIDEEIAVVDQRLGLLKMPHTLQGDEFDRIAILDRRKQELRTQRSTLLAPWSDLKFRLGRR